MNDKKVKKENEYDEADIKKAIYKSILKSLRNKKLASKIVDDIEDPNWEAEINPKDIPHQKTNVF